MKIFLRPWEGGRQLVGRGRAVATAAEVGWRWESTFSREGPGLPFGDSLEKQEVKKITPHIDFQRTKGTERCSAKSLLRVGSRKEIISS